MGTVKVDLEHWPVVVHVSEGTTSDAELDAYIEEATAILRRGVPHAVVMDASQLASATPYARRRKQAWLVENEALLRQHCVATAVVLKSPLMRFISSMVMLVRPFPTPYRVFDDVEEAIVWASRQCEASAAAREDAAASR